MQGGLLFFFSFPRTRHSFQHLVLFLPPLSSQWVSCDEGIISEYCHIPRRTFSDYDENKVRKEGKKGDGRKTTKHDEKFEDFHALLERFFECLKLSSFEVRRAFVKFPYTCYAPREPIIVHVSTSVNSFEWRGILETEFSFVLQSLKSLFKTHHHDLFNGLRHSSLHLMGICFGVVPAFEASASTVIE
jgi:hypothetical protein